LEQIMKYAIYYKYETCDATEDDFRLFDGLSYHEAEDNAGTTLADNYPIAISSIIDDIVDTADGCEFDATYILIPYNDDNSQAFHGVDDLKALHASAEPMTKVTITSDDEGTDTIEKIV